MGKIKVKNLLNHDVIISVPDMRFRREIHPNQAVSIDSEKLDEAMSYEGVANLFRKGYLRIDSEPEDVDIEVFEDLGIDLEANHSLLSVEELVKIMQEGTDQELKEILESTESSRKQVVIAAALKADGLTYSKMNMINKYTGENIIALRKKQQDLEDVKDRKV